MSLHGSGFGGVDIEGSFDRFNPSGGFDIASLLGGGGGLGGLAGFAAGPFGPPASIALSGLLSGLGSLFGGDSGRKRRLREAQSIFRGLSSSEIDEGALSRGSALFERSQLPTLERLFSQAAGRVGLDSGIGQGFALGGFQNILAGFNSQQLRDEQNRVQQRRLTGAQGLLSLADF